MNLSQLALATKVDMAANFINNIEHGKKWISPESMQKLCNALGIEPYQLFLPERADVVQKDAAVAACCDEIAKESGRIIREVRAKYLG